MDLTTYEYDIIKNAIMTIPGVKSLANYHYKDSDDFTTDDIQKAVEIISTGSMNKVKVYVVLANGFNIREVASEIQIRVKYELEKQHQFNSSYTVDVVVENL